MSASSIISESSVNLLTLDIGTSEIKVCVFNLVGETLATNRSEITLCANGPFVELAPEAIWQAIKSGIQRIPKDLRKQIRAAAIASHGESFVALDKHQKPISNVILNIDSRAHEEMADFAASFGREGLYQKTGLPPHPMYTLPKIAWLRHHQPEIFDRAARFLCVEDYVLSRFQIEPAISCSLASRTLGFDIYLGCWDEDLLQFAGISPRQMSRVENSGEPLGPASSSVASELGLPPDVVWCTAGHDQACAAAGSGVLETGTIADGTGTFECVCVPLGRPLLSPISLAANLPCECHSVPGKFLTLAYVPGGVALRWLREQRADAPDYDVLLGGLPIEPTGILAFPYFLGTGTPWMDSTAKAGMYGLSNDTSYRAVVQAVLEGICYEMKLNLELLRDLGISIDKICATGGGARSEAWLQLKSDIFGCPVVHVPGEASSRGAAMSAAIALGEYDSWDEAMAGMVERGRIFEPRSVEQVRYKELFEKYKELADRLYGYKLPPVQDQVHPKELTS